jgi:hypothetical protein
MLWYLLLVMSAQFRLPVAAGQWSRGALYQSSLLVVRIGYAGVPARTSHAAQQNSFEQMQAK